MSKHILVHTFTMPDGAEQDWELGFCYTAGDPGVHTFRNGDPGYPPSGPDVEWVSARPIVGDQPSGGVMKGPWESDGQGGHRRDVQLVHCALPTAPKFGEAIDYDALMDLLQLEPAGRQRLDDELYQEACDQVGDQDADDGPDFDESEDA